MVQVRNGVPGLSVGVSRNGRCIWERGFGYADVEQLVPCKSDTVMRIASISKPVTAALAARLVQNGKLNLDASVQVSTFCCGNNPFCVIMERKVYILPVLEEIINADN